VFRLLDLMLSEEAFLIGRFGEKGVDWNDAGVTDLDFYGNSAAVRVVNQLGNKMQNKTLSELGPFYAWPQYADSVTYTGFEADAEYIDARAHMAYQPHLPEERFDAVTVMADATSEQHDLRAAIDAFTDKSILDFMTGVLDPNSDAAWQGYLAEYERMELLEFVAKAQAVYDEGRVDR
jgi:hypothetical protein